MPTDKARLLGRVNFEIAQEELRKAGYIAVAPRWEDTPIAIQEAYTEAAKAVIQANTERSA